VTINYWATAYIVIYGAPAITCLPHDLSHAASFIAESVGSM